MAITEERLQELIKQEAMVYRHLRRWEYYNERVEAVKLSKTYYIDFDCGSLELCSRTGEHLSRLDDLYEHKADAEWDLEFGNVERTDKLTLKNWNDIKIEPQGEIYRFYTPKGKLVVFEAYKYLTILVNRNSIFTEPVNKENYTEACRLIKKLFMGEE